MFFDVLKISYLRPKFEKKEKGTNPVKGTSHRISIYTNGIDQICDNFSDIIDLGRLLVTRKASSHPNMVSKHDVGSNEEDWSVCSIT